MLIGLSIYFILLYKLHLRRLVNRDATARVAPGIASCGSGGRDTILPFVVCSLKRKMLIRTYVIHITRCAWARVDTCVFALFVYAYFLVVLFGLYTGLEPWKRRYYVLVHVCMTIIPFGHLHCVWTWAWNSWRSAHLISPLWGGVGWRRRFSEYFVCVWPCLC